MENPSCGGEDSKALLEALFVSCESSDHFSVRVIDPISGSSQWSFKGSELQGGIVRAAELIGSNYDSLAIALADKSAIHVSTIRTSKAGSTKSTLPGAVRCIAAHPSGQFLYGTIGNKLYTWALRSGELLSVEDAHIEAITSLASSKCGNYLSTGSAGGEVCFYIVAELMRRSSKAKTHYKYSPHTSAVEDVYITSGTDPRILTVSADRSLSLHSISTQQTLVKLSADQPLTACCMDPAEARIFIGGRCGKIGILDLFSTALFSMSQLRVEASKHGRTEGVSFLSQHSAPVSKLAVNNDGSRLASGDCHGVYCVWEISNGQCMKTGTMKGKVAQLKFILNWPSMQATTSSDRIPPLCTNLNEGPITIHLGEHRNSSQIVLNEELLDNHLDRELENFSTKAAVSCIEEESIIKKRPRIEEESSKRSQTAPNGSVADAESRIKDLKDEISRLKATNKELFDLALQVAKEKPKS